MEGTRLRRQGSWEQGDWGFLWLQRAQAGKLAQPDGACGWRQSPAPARRTVLYEPCPGLGVKSIVLATHSQRAQKTLEGRRKKRQRLS